jgi:hypothetical protein
MLGICPLLLLHAYPYTPLVGGIVISAFLV